MSKKMGGVSKSHKILKILCFSLVLSTLIATPLLIPSCSKKTPPAPNPTEYIGSWDGSDWKGHDRESENLMIEVISEEDKTAMIANAVGYAARDLVIPYKVNNNGKFYSIIRIASYAFRKWDIENLKGTLTLPDTLKEIEMDGFYECTNLTKIIFGKSLKTIGDYAFYKTGLIGSLTFPNSVETIGEGAFSSCFDLTKLKLGASIQTIGEYAFFGCSFSDITLEGNNNHFKFASRTSVGEAKIVLSEEHESDDFDYASDQPIGSLCIGRLTIPDYVTHIDGNIFLGSNLFDIELQNSEKNHFKFADNVGEAKVVLSKEHESDNFDYTSDWPISGLAVGELSVPNNIVGIGDMAFVGCSNLRGLVLGNSILEIGYLAFMGCNRISGILTIPNSVITINDEAFESTAIRQLTIPNSLINLNIGCFTEMKYLEKIILKDWDNVTDKNYDNFIFNRSNEKGGIVSVEGGSISPLEALNFLKSKGLPEAWRLA